MQAFLSASSAREMVALLAGMRARIFFWRAPDSYSVPSCKGMKGSLCFSSVSPKWFSTFRAEEEPLNLVGNGVEDARIAERFLCEAYIPSGGEGSSRRS